MRTPAEEAICIHAGPGDDAVQRADEAGQNDQCEKKREARVMTAGVVFGSIERLTKLIVLQLNKLVIAQHYKLFVLRYGGSPVTLLGV